jgi:hypothetical protein
MPKRGNVSHSRIVAVAHFSLAGMPEIVYSRSKGTRNDKKPESRVGNADGTDFAGRHDDGAVA